MAARISFFLFFFFNFKPRVVKPNQREKEGRFIKGERIAIQRGLHDQKDPRALIFPSD